MIRTWPGQTKEEWLAEYQRNKSLAPEEREKELNEFLYDIKKQDEENERENVVQKQERSENSFANYDHPNSLENSEATIVWIIVMAVGAIFKGNWIIWIVATIILRRYITRHKIKK